MAAAYDSVRSAVLSSGTDSRVEVNQRALIDKILARYASAGAVYRELLQNSNDADAATAEIRFATAPTPAGPVVAQVVYRNDGHPFRPQDWARLRNIAEGNPDVSKVGAFGVGAYTMFSICEEPLVISGPHALAFAWKADALWTKTAPSPHPADKWTTFVLPSRDPYPPPDLVPFGQFLCSALTFTHSLATIRVFVDDREALVIAKRQLQPPAVLTPPKASSWWSNDGAVTHSPSRIFSLARADASITETVFEMSVTLDAHTASVRARYVSALAHARVPADMARKMQRVTKKKPPSHVNVQLFIDAAAKSTAKRRSRAAAITDAFSPGMGTGSVFIGFKTSQTTGLAAHLAAPLIPTVEREAIDFQDPTLRVYNSELLSIAGILMRLTLEHSMSLVGVRWDATRAEREALEEHLKKETATQESDDKREVASAESHAPPQREQEKASERGGLFGFAKFMSSGVRKIADVISSVDFRGGQDEDLLNPSDPRPLSEEEKDAIMLMRSFCPQQSTPDPRVGTIVANGFGSCMPNVSPPVLTRSGVVRSANSRLPLYGMERFVTKNVVRKIVLQNAEDYLRHVASCHTLSLRDLEDALEDNPLQEDDLVRLLKWWTKFCRLDPEAARHGPALKQRISFFENCSNKPSSERGPGEVAYLKTVQYFVDEKVFDGRLPMPSSVLPKSVRESVGQRVLSDKSLAPWFTSLPFEVWATFICRHPCMTEGQHVDANARLLSLAALSKEHEGRSGEGRVLVEQWLHENLSTVRCIPFHSLMPAPLATELPTDLYLSSAELSVFEGLGSFKKVSPALAKAGITDDFLIALGVRKAIAIDFLFTQLDNLKWSDNPKPLIAYLRSATLTERDLEKLRNTQYLPEVKDKTRTYAPSELHLPNPELAAFPFVKVLHWPASDNITDKSQDGRFLKRLGCRVDPDLASIFRFLTDNVKEEDLRIKVLDFVNKRLAPGGIYEREYTTSSSALSSGPSRFLSMKFLPTVRQDPLARGEHRRELQAPRSCYSDVDVLCMGFAVFDPQVQTRKGKSYAEAFRIAPKPLPDRLVYQLLNVVSHAKSKLSRPDGSNQKFRDDVVRALNDMFRYLSTRANEFDKNMIDTLKGAPFIPCQTESGIHWVRPDGVYFKNVNDDTAELTSTLYYMIDFSPFLAAVGVKSEPSLHDLFRLLISSPNLVLEKLGTEAKYRTLLRRVAANPPYSKVTPEIRNSAFLLAYQQDQFTQADALEAADSQTSSALKKYTLAKASDICIIDNSFFARMFNILSAPPESDLERFYESIGSQYISKRVEQDFEVVGQQLRETPLTFEFKKRIKERAPLLVSPSVTSRPLRPNAAALLQESNLEAFEVVAVKAIYTLGGNVRTQDITCCAKPRGRRKSAIYLTQGFDWFDVGNAIGGLILKRCQLEDAFFLGSLLEAPLKQLRARGFPVDRIMGAAEPVKPRKSNHDQGEVIPPGSSQGRRDNHSQIVQGRDQGGFGSILQQMFPDCDSKHIQRLLGTEPSLDTLRQAADSLADGNYPKKQAPRNEQSTAEIPAVPQRSPPTADPQVDRDIKRQSMAHDSSKGKAPRKSGTLNPLTRALRGMRGASGIGGLFPSTGRPVVQQDAPQIVASEPRDSTRPVSPHEDAATQGGLERMLANSVRSSRSVSANGVSSPETLLTSIPKGLERDGNGCEVIPGHNLKPCQGRYGTGRTRNGIRVFSSRRHPESEQFLESNFDVVNSFSVVLEQLCTVYSLQIDTVAIFHEPAGGTIAFNSNKALHFNVRFFSSLHYRGNNSTIDSTCYAYWFTTMAHELAHNLVAPHNKEHGYFTESYVTLYLPKLVGLLPR